MQTTRYLIIGGGIAGTTAAEAIRKRDADGRIVLVSDEPYRLYSRITLSKPNFFLEKIPFEQIWLKDDTWYAENRIDLIAGKRAARLNADERAVALDDGTEIRYEKALLALGGAARPWAIPGAGTPGVFSLRTLDDAKAIMASVKTAKRAVAVGGGFISFEMCEMMRMAGLQVTLILREPYYWSPTLDEASGRMIEEALERGGVTIRRSAEVAEVRGGAKVESVVLKDGAAIPCDMVIVGIGIVYPFEWLKGSGIRLGRGILADEYLATNLQNIWTAGDCAEFTDLVVGERVQLGNWVNAQMQGNVAGQNMAGVRTPFRLVSFYTTQGFGMTIAFAGDARVGPDRSVIARGSPESGSYGRLIVKDGEIVGATLINRTQELSAIAKLIERDVNVNGRAAELSNPALDLTTLLS